MMSGSLSIPGKASAAAACEAIAAGAARGAAVVSGQAAKRVPPASCFAEVFKLDLKPLQAVIEHEPADQVICVQTGIAVAQLNASLALHKQFFPARVPDDWTLLDVINAGDVGALEQGFGGARQLVLGLQASLAGGAMINCGGRVVKNVTGYDTTKLLVGSQATLAVPLAAHLRLYALPESSATLSWSNDSLWQLMRSALLLRRSGLPLACLELGQNDRLQLGGGRYLLLAQVMASKAVQAELLAGAQLAAGQAEEQLDGQQERQLWSYLTDTFMAAPAEKSLRLAAPPAVLPELLTRLPHGCRWQASPSSGLAQVLTDAPQEAAAELGAYAGRQAQPLVVAYADERYNYRFSRLPVADLPASRLKQRLKQQFDPQGILNPFALV